MRARRKLWVLHAEEEATADSSGQFREEGGTTPTKADAVVAMQRRAKIVVESIDMMAIQDVGLVVPISRFLVTSEGIARSTSIYGLGMAAAILLLFRVMCHFDGSMSSASSSLPSM